MTTDGVNCLNDLRKSNSGFHPLLKGLKHLRIKGSANRYKFQLQTPKIVADNSRPPLDNVKVNVSRIKMKSNLTLFTAAISLTHEVAQSHE